MLRKRSLIYIFCVIFCFLNFNNANDDIDALLYMSKSSCNNCVQLQCKLEEDSNCTLTLLYDKNLNKVSFSLDILSFNSSWVAIGFNSIKRMIGTNVIVLNFVQQFDIYNGYLKYYNKPIYENNNITNISMTHLDGRTVVKFDRSTDLFTNSSFNFSDCNYITVGKGALLGNDFKYHLNTPKFSDNCYRIVPLEKNDLTTEIKNPITTSSHKEVTTEPSTSLETTYGSSTKNPESSADFFTTIALSTIRHDTSIEPLTNRFSNNELSTDFHTTDHIHSTFVPPTSAETIAMTQESNKFSTYEPSTDSHTTDHIHSTFIPLTSTEPNTQKIHTTMVPKTDSYTTGHLHSSFVPGTSVEPTSVTQEVKLSTLEQTIETSIEPRTQETHRVSSLEPETHRVSSLEPETSVEPTSMTQGVKLSTLEHTTETSIEPRTQETHRVSSLEPKTSVEPTTMTQDIHTTMVTKTDSYTTGHLHSSFVPETSVEPTSMTQEVKLSTLEQTIETSIEPRTQETHKVSSLEPETSIESTGSTQRTEIAQTTVQSVTTEKSIFESTTNIPTETSKLILSTSGDSVTTQDRQTDSTSRLFDSTQTETHHELTTEKFTVGSTHGERDTEATTTKIQETLVPTSEQTTRTESKGETTIQTTTVITERTSTVSLSSDTMRPTSAVTTAHETTVITTQPPLVESTTVSLSTETIRHISTFTTTLEDLKTKTTQNGATSDYIIPSTTKVNHNNPTSERILISTSTPYEEQKETKADTGGKETLVTMSTVIQSTILTFTDHLFLIQMRVLSLYSNLVSSQDEQAKLRSNVKQYAEKSLATNSVARFGFIEILNFTQEQDEYAKVYSLLNVKANSEIKETDLANQIEDSFKNGDNSILPVEKASLVVQKYIPSIIPENQMASTVNGTVVESKTNTILAIIFGSVFGSLVLFALIFIFLTFYYCYKRKRSIYYFGGSAKDYFVRI